ncbi:P-II family nitrogen regulator [Methyloterricola oryzae]|uniref:P-II family nitrogen regulator n=1 Tax=Methyloterricola oryzae TaxID=1495050 RepID=UPI0005EAFCFF|nr:P-II family nitrogen regulator [Methyloterricola oryzae]
MKQITAIIQPHRLEKVEEALHRLEHLPGFTILNARGHPRGKGPKGAFTAHEWAPDSHAQLVLLIICANEQGEEVVEAIRKAAYTGHPGDGLIAVSDVFNVLRISSGEQGPDAI